MFYKQRNKTTYWFHYRIKQRYQLFKDRNWNLARTSYKGANAYNSINFLQIRFPWWPLSLHLNMITYNWCGTSSYKSSPNKQPNNHSSFLLLSFEVNQCFSLHWCLGNVAAMLSRQEFVQSPNISQWKRKKKQIALEMYC